MSIIKVENITFSYPSSYDNIFENVNFQIDTDWKLGFIGRNGKGKTTFLNLLLGKYEYTGKIISSVKFDYFPYKIHEKSLNSIDILYEISPTANEWQFLRELSYLDLDSDVLHRPFCTLSNGEQTKIMLAALFLNEGHFMLIDEPTNHLDTQARQCVSAYLRKKKSYILVSHDRQFLDGCIDHILSLNKSDIEIQRGNFSSFMTNFERQHEFEQKQNSRLKSEIVRLQTAAQQTSAWSDRTEASKIGAVDKGFVGHKSAKLMKRAKVAEARRQKAIDEKSQLLKNAEPDIALKILPLDYRAERLISFSNVVPIYNDKLICSPVSFEITRGERIAINGKNGCGKSSILKLLCGHGIQHSGSVSVGSNLIISYVPQDTSHLQGTLTDFAFENNIDDGLFRAILYKMGVNKKQFDKNISDFSDGQKKKILIAKSLCQKAHLYVWDEPLNFIDIYSRIQIENLLREFRPTMIFVEHDKAFQDAIATRIIKLF